MVLIAWGAVAAVAFIRGQAISPTTGQGNPSPDCLARSPPGAFGPPDGEPRGNLTHLLLVGPIGRPAGGLLVFRPVGKRMVSGAGWFFLAAL